MAKTNGLDKAMLRELAKEYIDTLPYPHQSLAKRYLLYGNPTSINEMSFIEFIEGRSDYAEEESED